MLTKYSFKTKKMIELNEEEIQQCAEVFSENYGFYSAQSPYKPNERIRMSVKFYKKRYVKNDFYISYAIFEGREVAHAIYLRKTMPNNHVMTWVVQLVVAEAHRNKGIGGKLLHSIWGFSSDTAWGLATSNPFTVKTLEIATFRKVKPVEVLKHLEEIKELGNLVEFVKSYKVDKNQSLVDSNFFVNVDEIEENIDKADQMVRQAAAQGANIILLPELFERPYFCQERRYEYYAYAKPVMENDAVLHFMEVAKELHVVLPISFYEKDGNVLYNSIAIIDADGTMLGVYRKTHIPDDHYYQEKFYFTPGNTGFRVWDTAFGKIGVGICWDQWFPETARAMAVKGAEILLYPTAIGSEPILECDSMPHWRRCMQGHAGSNLMPVMAANRIGEETVTPCEENGG